MDMEKYERCVICGRATDILAQTPLEQRSGYVETVGQLCTDCYGKLLEERLHRGWQKGWEPPRRKRKKVVFRLLHRR